MASESGTTRPFSETVRQRMETDPAFREALFDEVRSEAQADFIEVAGALRMWNMSTEALDRIKARFGRRSGALHDIEAQTNDLTAAEVAREALAT